MAHAQEGRGRRRGRLGPCQPRSARHGSGALTWPGRWRPPPRSAGPSWPRATAGATSPTPTWRPCTTTTRRSSAPSWATTPSPACSTSSTGWGCGTCADAQGRLFPRSRAATSVLDVLLAEMRRARRRARARPLSAGGVAGAPPTGQVVRGRPGSLAAQGRPVGCGLGDLGGGRAGPPGSPASVPGRSRGPRGAAGAVPPGLPSARPRAGRSTACACPCAVSLRSQGRSVVDAAGAARCSSAPTASRASSMFDLSRLRQRRRRPLRSTCVPDFSPRTSSHEHAGAQRLERRPRGLREPARHVSTFLERGAAPRASAATCMEPAHAGPTGRAPGRPRAGSPGSSSRVPGSSRWYGPDETDAAQVIQRRPRASTPSTPSTLECHGEPGLSRLRRGARRRRRVRRIQPRMGVGAAVCVAGVAAART